MSEKQAVCGECGGVINFAGECPRGHRARDPGTAEPEVVDV